MYEKIGLFEKKLKVVVFNEMCLKYVNCEDCSKDKTCTIYLCEYPSDNPRHFPIL